MAKAPKFSAKDLETAAAETCASAILLSPSVPVVTLAAQLVDEADPVFAAEYGRALMIEDFARRLRAEKAAKAHTPRPAQLGMFEHLPLRIMGVRDEAVLRCRSRRAFSGPRRGSARYRCRRPCRETLSISATPGRSSERRRNSGKQCVAVWPR